MLIHIGRKKYKVFALDIETHADSESIAKKETSMWLGSFIDENSKEDDEASYFYSMPELFKRLNEITLGKRKNKNENRPCKNICIYIYNLSFEWSFILPELLKTGFVFKEDIEKEDAKVFCSVSTKSVSSVWCATLKFGKKNGFVVFRDLAKMFSGGLSNVAKSFALPTQKGDIDFSINRLHGWKVTPEEKMYNFKDSKICMDILEEQFKKDDKDFWQSSSIASYACRKMIASGFPKSKKPMGAFRKIYPELGFAENEYLRNSVSGGICYATPAWQFKNISQRIMHIDAHQMHPSQAFSKLFPYGKGEFFTGEPTKTFGTICCCRIEVSYDAVYLHSQIKLIGINFVDDFEMTVWDFEIATMKKCYKNLVIKYLDGYKYKCSFLPWRKFYSNNYSDRLIARAEKNEYNINMFKKLNNCSYGKMLEKPHNEIFENTLNEKEIITSNIIEKTGSDIKVNSKYTYLPIGSCIPAYSRVQLIETALKFGYQNVIYFDTDSIFIIDSENAQAVLKTLPTKDWLCNWGIEPYITKAQFACPKRYKMQPENKPCEIKMAGINGIQQEYEETNVVSSTWRVKRAYRVKGGTLIEFQTKKVEVQPKYREIAKRNIEYGN